MVKLDTQLIQLARRFCTDDNVHHVTQLISLYENAVQQSQEGNPYEAPYEDSLRAFVAAAGERDSFARDWRAMRKYSSELNQRSNSINAEIDKYFSERLLSPDDSEAA